MTKVVVLGFLLDGPLHGYAMQQRLRSGRYDLWAEIQPNSIYNALRKLERDGSVHVVRTETKGHQARHVYGITDAGRREFGALLARSLSDHSRSYPVDLYVAIEYLDQISVHAVRTALATYRDALHAEDAAWSEGYEKKARTGPSAPLLRAVLDNGRAHIAADIRLVTYLLDHLDEHVAMFQEVRRG